MAIHKVRSFVADKRRHFGLDKILNSLFVIKRWRFELILLLELAIPSSRSKVLHNPGFIFDNLSLYPLHTHLTQVLPTELTLSPSTLEHLPLFKAVGSRLDPFVLLFIYLPLVKQ